MARDPLDTKSKNWVYIPRLGEKFVHCPYVGRATHREGMPIEDLLPERPFGEIGVSKEELLFLNTKYWYNNFHVYNPTEGVLEALEKLTYKLRRLQ